MLGKPLTYYSAGSNELIGPVGSVFEALEEDEVAFAV
jgi:hypothetical protein